MSERYKVGDTQMPHFITITITNWIDLFIRKAYKDTIIESLKYCQKQKGLKIYAYVIMSSHLHLIVSSTETPTLPEIVRDFKKYTSKQLIALIKEIPESRRDWMLNQFEHMAIQTRRGRIL